MSQLSIGVQAPDFVLNSAGGPPRRLSEALEGGPVVLAFYKASCPTSEFTFPFLQKIFGARDGQGTEIWGISQDDAEETRRFADQLGIGFNLLIDDYPYEVSSAYGLESLPAIFIVDENGTIILSDFGFTKTTLNRIAGFEMFTPDDGYPATRPG